MPEAAGIGVSGEALVTGVAGPAHAHRTADNVSANDEILTFSFDRTPIPDQAQRVCRVKERHNAKADHLFLAASGRGSPSGHAGGCADDCGHSVQTTSENDRGDRMDLVRGRIRGGVRAIQKRSFLEVELRVAAVGLGGAISAVPTSTRREECTQKVQNQWGSGRSPEQSRGRPHGYPACFESRWYPLLQLRQGQREIPIAPYFFERRLQRWRSGFTLVKQEQKYPGNEKLFADRVKGETR